MRGFQLVGAKYASCMNGKWDADLPICVKYGCRAPSATHVNGQFIESYRGAVVKVICNPGYNLVGSPSVYCNGIRWNETFPVCKVFNKTPEKSCDFESEDICGWNQDPMHDFDWRRRKKNTDDTNNDNDDNGFYMYMPNIKMWNENITARLYSPVYPSNYSNGTYFKFSYMMKGSDTDTLKIYVKPENVELYNLIPSFWMSGKQGEHWNVGYFNIEYSTMPFQSDSEKKKRILTCDLKK
ncbi:conserved hypothetical protein [Pediculus humanus corporis]|uniref:Uncharacterized protein n=1 Tax=Pediculus humanus subsp. corporis TaxID=121224 RepID=E0VPB7_PEDHC|nr:uncharacterized protein Phum_PHUM356530 [Pediculus humanus corporis]EEB15223.1 conserved hypothetical protein [Pediculus humanus corporis]